MNDKIGSLEDPASQGWHFDKRIPLAMIAAIIGQTVGATVWITTLSNSVSNNDKAISQLTIKIERIEDDRRDIQGRMIRVEEAVKTVAENVKTTNSLLEKLIEEQRKRRSSLFPKHQSD